MSILLIGYRGSGKTTVGKRLAVLLNWKFADLDERVVEKAGKTIKDIFEQDGEAVFRATETAALKMLIDLQNHVISLGGGAVLAEENQKMIAESRHDVVYLKTDAEELHRRIVADPVTMLHRPGLTHLGGSIDEVRQLLSRREPLYQALSTIQVDAGDTPDHIAQTLHAMIASCGER